MYYPVYANLLLYVDKYMYSWVTYSVYACVCQALWTRTHCLEGFMLHVFKKQKQKLKNYNNDNNNNKNTHSFMLYMNITDAL